MPKDIPELNDLADLVSSKPAKSGYNWRDGIHHHSFSSEEKHGVVRVVCRSQRWFPSANSLGAELLGEAERDAQMQKTGRIIRPRLARRIEIYLEMLAVVEESKRWHELFAVAAHRRQVTHLGGIASIDTRFLELALRASPEFAPKEWLRCAECMPPRSTLYQICLCRSGNVPPSQ